MRISILNPEMSGNCLGRSYLLAKMLRRKHEVEIVGCQHGENIWEPVSSDDDIPYVAVRTRSRIERYTRLRELYSLIKGDVVYAGGPLFTTFGVGLVCSCLKRKPLVLDIDEWQPGFLRAKMDDMTLPGKMVYMGSSALTWYSMASYWNITLFDRLTGLADRITVSNSFLADRYGGTVIPHARNTDSFNPDEYDRASCRADRGFADERRVVMFFGTPRRHKGLEDLIEAVRMLEDESALLAIVGLDDRDAYSVRIKAQAESRLGERFKGFGIQPIDSIPGFLAAADVVAVPQRLGPASVGQMPAKIFDAMAMAKPVVATRVNDIEDVLNGCGWVVEPDNPRELAAALREALEDPVKADELGHRARRRCVEKYSYDAVEPVLMSVFEEYE